MRQSKQLFSRTVLIATLLSVSSAALPTEWICMDCAFFGNHMEGAEKDGPAKKYLKILDPVKVYNCAEAANETGTAHKDSTNVQKHNFSLKLGFADCGLTFEQSIENTSSGGCSISTTTNGPYTCGFVYAGNYYNKQKYNTIKCRPHGGYLGIGICSCIFYSSFYRGSHRIFLNDVCQSGSCTVSH